MEVTTAHRYADGEAVIVPLHTRGHCTHVDDGEDAVAKARALDATWDWLPWRRPSWRPKSST